VAGGGEFAAEGGVFRVWRGEGISGGQWNVTTILHRMQGVIREFLRYHGYEVGRWLLAVPESSWERGEGPQDFGVRVRVHRRC
jgi:hypothetical protein